MSEQQTYIVTDYVPEDKNHFTVGKWYKCNIINRIANFVDDDGDSLKAYTGESHHLNGKPWQVKQGPPPADYIEDEHGNWSPPEKETKETMSDNAELKLEWGDKVRVEHSDEIMTFIGIHPFDTEWCVLAGFISGIKLRKITQVIPYREKLRMPVGALPAWAWGVTMDPDGSWWCHAREPRLVSHGWDNDWVSIPEKYWPTNYTGTWQESATPVSEIEFYDGEVT